MKPKKYAVRLTNEERKQLEEMTKRGKRPAAIIKRVNILLNLDENGGSVKRQSEIADLLNVSIATIYTVSRQYAQQGLLATISRKPRQNPPRKPIVTGDVEARIIALACGKAPDGRSRWTLRLLEKKVVELQIVEAISDNTIGRLLKKHHLSLI